MTKEIYLTNLLQLKNYFRIGSHIRNINLNLKKMKNLKILTLGTVILLSQACQQKNTDTKQASTVEVVKEENKEEVNENPNQVVFENLDQILSPFEDMTEFALNKSDEGISKSLNKVETAVKEGVFAKNLTPESYKSLNSKIEQLKGYANTKNYEQVALTSTDIFEYNTSNFVDTKKIQNQIRIEHLDYMGFKVLALLNQKNVNWQAIEQTIEGVKKEWLALSPEIKDNNLKDSFEYLFEGLSTSAKNKDTKMGEILASMDLSLVDVLENSF